MEKQFNLKNITKVYPDHSGGTTALKNATLNFKTGEFIAILGKSGSGKSTLLNMLSGIDRPTSGEIIYDNRPLHSLTESALTAWRGKNIGIIFQFFQLIPTLTILENIILPMDLCSSYPTGNRKNIALDLLNQVEIGEHANKLPVDLSGGQQQRAAIARALANNPPFIVADEPTGNLDTYNANKVVELFRKMTNDGKTIIMVTHDTELAKLTDRIITIEDGIITSDLTSRCIN